MCERCFIPNTNKETSEFEKAIGLVAEAVYAVLRPYLFTGLFELPDGNLENYVSDWMHSRGAEFTKLKLSDCAQCMKLVGFVDNRFIPFLRLPRVLKIHIEICAASIARLERSSDTTGLIPVRKRWGMDVPMFARFRIHGLSRKFCAFIWDTFRPLGMRADEFEEICRRVSPYMQADEQVRTDWGIMTVERSGRVIYPQGAPAAAPPRAGADLPMPLLGGDHGEEGQGAQDAASNCNLDSMDGDQGEWFLGEFTGFWEQGHDDDGLWSL